MLYRPDLAKNLFVCTTCKHHFRMHAFDRIAMLVDADFVEIGGDVVPGDPLGWTDKTSYPQKLERDREKSKLTEGVVCGFAIDRRLSGGARRDGFQLSRRHDGHGRRRTPRAFVRRRARAQAAGASSARRRGGARMEEGMLALMQMAKTTVALQRFRDDGGYAITVLTDPTTGGVSASFAFQADVIVAEARASIGFAGRRVIEQTIRQKLPENFQTAEFLLEHGAIDMVVERSELRELLIRLLDYGVGARRAGAPPATNGRAPAGATFVNAIVEREKRLARARRAASPTSRRTRPISRSISRAEIRALEEKYAQIQRDIFGHLTPWQRVNMARHPKRPLGSAYIAALDQFDELHGDRHFGDDPAIVGGFAKLRGRRDRRDRARQGRRHEGKGPPQLRHAAARGLSQSAAAGAAGRAIWACRS